jgi:hypothetical protein
VAADVEAEAVIDDGFRETADLIVGIEDDRRHAALREIVRRGESRRPGADDDDRPLGRRDHEA